MTRISDYGRNDKIRKRIMHYAKGLFEEKGIENVTFSDIAAAAEVSRTTVFNHFGSTNGLLVALGKQEVDDVAAHCREKENEGEKDVKNVFEVLIRDFVLYPALMIRIISAMIMSSVANNPVKRIEDMILERVNGEEKKVIILTGAFYGLLNHYYVNAKAFDADIMLEIMNEMIDGIMANK